MRYLLRKTRLPTQADYYQPPANASRWHGIRLISVFLGQEAHCGRRTTFGSLSCRRQLGFPRAARLLSNAKLSRLMAHAPQRWGALRGAIPPLRGVAEDALAKQAMAGARGETSPTIFLPQIFIPQNEGSAAYSLMPSPRKAPSGLRIRLTRADCFWRTSSLTVLR